MRSKERNLYSAFNKKCQDAQSLLFVSHVKLMASNVFVILFLLFIHCLDILWATEKNSQWQYSHSYEKIAIRILEQLSPGATIAAESQRNTVAFCLPPGWRHWGSRSSGKYNVPHSPPLASRLQKGVLLLWVIDEKLGKSWSLERVEAWNELMKERTRTRTPVLRIRHSIAGNAHFLSHEKPD